MAWASPPPGRAARTLVTLAQASSTLMKSQKWDCQTVLGSLTVGGGSRCGYVSAAVGATGFCGDRVGGREERARALGSAAWADTRTSWLAFLHGPHSVQLG